MSYLVVFENTVKCEGYTGIRNIASYNNKESFEHRLQDDDFRKVIAEGVTAAEAEALVALTPEICVLTTAIEEICWQDNGEVDSTQVRTALENASDKISIYRSCKKGQRPHGPLPFVEIGDEDTEKNRLYRYIKETFTNPNGTIGNIKQAEALIESKIDEIALDRLQDQLEAIVALFWIQCPLFEP